MAKLKTKTYNEDDIKALLGLDKVRGNVAMYLGELGDAMMFRAIKEPVENSRDEYEAGRNNAIYVAYNNKVGEYVIADCAQGIPVGDKLIDGKKISALTLILTELHAGGKFDSSAYETSGGCFVGSTRVRLLDGTTPTFEELYSRFEDDAKPFDVFSLDPKTGEVGINACYNVQITKYVDQLAVIELDNGETIECTVDHPFYTTGLKKVQAQKLKAGMSLRSLDFKQDKDGYLVSRELGRVHRFVMEYNGEDIDNLHVHHENEDKTDNRYENLKAITQKEHYEEHPDKWFAWMDFVKETAHLKSEMLTELNTDPDFIFKQVTGKAIKIGSRCLVKFGRINKELYEANRFHGAPSWSTLKYYFDKPATFRKYVEDTVAYFQDRLDKKQEIGQRFFDSLDYEVGLSANSMIFDNSEFMTAKRIVGKALNFVFDQKLTQEELLDLDFNKIYAILKSAKTLNAASVLKYITIGRFVDCVAHGLNPDVFLYTGVEAENRRIKLEAKQRRLEAKQKVSDYTDRRKQTAYSRFLITLNACLSEVGHIDKDWYENNRTAGSPNWETGVELAKYFDSCSSNSELASLAQERNHKVVSVEIKKVDKVPVYGLSVENDHTYLLASGVFVGNTHGVGISALNAISKEFEVWTCRENQWYYQGFSCGKAITEVKKVSDSFLKKQFGYLATIKKKYKRLGSIVRFVPDQSVISVDANRTKKLKTYTQAILQPTIVEDYLKFMSTMNPKLLLTLHDLETNKIKEFYNDKGLSGIIGNILQDRELEGIGKPFEFDSGRLKVAIQWSNYHDTDLFRSYVNSSPTVDHGTHVTGFRAAMSKALKDYMPKKSGAFKPDDLYVGAVALINWKMNSAQFSGQVKDKLVSKIDNEVTDLLTEPLTEFFKKNKSLAKAIIKRASEVAASREDLAKVMKGMSEVKKSQGSLPVKLYEAPNCKPHERELYLVEGDSAGGCFIASTPVKLSNGNTITFEELVYMYERGFVCEGVSYSIEKDAFEISLLEHPRITKYVDELIEVTLEDNSVWLCTPDHLWLTGSEYTKAKDLTVEDHITKFDGLS